MCTGAAALILLCAAYNPYMHHVADAVLLQVKRGERMAMSILISCTRQRKPILIAVAPIWFSLRPWTYILPRTRRLCLVCIICNGMHAWRRNHLWLTRIDLQMSAFGQPRQLSQRPGKEIKWQLRPPRLSTRCWTQWKRRRRANFTHWTWWYVSDGFYCIVMSSNQRICRTFSPARDPLERELFAYFSGPLVLPPLGRLFCHFHPSWKSVQGF